MKKFVEASFQVDVAGLPPMFMDAKTPTDIIKKLRKQLRRPDDIQDIKRVTKGEKVRKFKDRLKGVQTGKGMDVDVRVEGKAYGPTGVSYSDEPNLVSGVIGNGKRKNAAKGKTIKGTIGAPKSVPNNEDAAQEDMLVDPKKHKQKKLQFLKPQDTTALKTDLARLKKALGPNHPMNKPKNA